MNKNTVVNIFPTYQIQIGDWVALESASDSSIVVDKVMHVYPDGGFKTQKYGNMTKADVVEIRTSFASIKRV